MPLYQVISGAGGSKELVEVGTFVTDNEGGVLILSLV